MTDPCSSYRERLHLYLDGEVESTETKEIETHLAECPLCHASLEELRSMERHLRAGLCDFVGCPHPRGLDGLSRTIDRVMQEPKPPWKNAPLDPPGRPRRRYFGWGALLIVGAATTVGVMRLSPISTAPLRAPKEPSAEPAQTAPVPAGVTVPTRQAPPIQKAAPIQEPAVQEVNLTEEGPGGLDTSSEAFAGARDALERETNALLAGAMTREGIDRARRLHSLGQIWERLATEGNSPHAFQRAIDAYAGALAASPQGVFRDSSDLQRVRREASGAPPR